MKRRHFFSRLTMVSVLAITAPLTLGWILTRHIPAWYEPPGLTPAELDAAQAELEDLLEAVTDRMVQGDAFTVTLTARQINRMLALQQARWPALTAWMKDRMKTPCVVIGPEKVTLGARCRWGALQSILSMDLSPAVQPRSLQVRVRASRAGSLPLPTSLLTRQCNTLMRSRDEHQATREDSTGPGTHKITLRLTEQGNRFEIDNGFDWPNGKIPFRVTAVRVSDQRITLDIQPQ